MSSTRIPDTASTLPIHQIPLPSSQPLGKTGKNTSEGKMRGLTDSFRNMLSASLRRSDGVEDAPSLREKEAKPKKSGSLIKTVFSNRAWIGKTRNNEPVHDLPKNALGASPRHSSSSSSMSSQNGSPQADMLRKRLLAETAHTQTQKLQESKGGSSAPARPAVPYERAMATQMRVNNFLNNAASHRSLGSRQAEMCNLAEELAPESYEKLEKFVNNNPEIVKNLTEKGWKGCIAEFGAQTMKDQGYEKFRGEIVALTEGVVKDVARSMGGTYGYLSVGTPALISDVDVAGIGKGLSQEHQAVCHELSYALLMQHVTASKENEGEGIRPSGFTLDTEFYTQHIEFARAIEMTTPEGKAHVARNDNDAVLLQALNQRGGIRITSHAQENFNASWDEYIQARLDKAHPAEREAITSGLHDIAAVKGHIEDGIKTAMLQNAGYSDDEIAEAEAKGDTSALCDQICAANPHAEALAKIQFKNTVLSHLSAKMDEAHDNANQVGVEMLTNAGFKLETDEHGKQFFKIGEDKVSVPTGIPEALNNLIAEGKIESSPAWDSENIKGKRLDLLRNVLYDEGYLSGQTLSDVLGQQGYLRGIEKHRAVAEKEEDAWFGGGDVKDRASTTVGQLTISVAENLETYKGHYAVKQSHKEHGGATPTAAHQYALIENSKYSLRILLASTALLETIAKECPDETISNKVEQLYREGQAYLRPVTELEQLKRGNILPATSMERELINHFGPGVSDEKREQVARFADFTANSVPKLMLLENITPQERYEHVIGGMVSSGLFESEADAEADPAITTIVKASCGFPAADNPGVGELLAHAKNDRPTLEKYALQSTEQITTLNNKLQEFAENVHNLVLDAKAKMPEDAPAVVNTEGKVEVKARKYQLNAAAVPSDSSSTVGLAGLLAAAKKRGRGEI